MRRQTLINFGLETALKEFRDSMMGINGGTTVRIELDAD